MISKLVSKRWPQLRLQMTTAIFVAFILPLSSCNNPGNATHSADSSSVKQTDSSKIITNAKANVDSAKKTMATIKPKGAAPSWAKGIKPEMLAVIEKLGSYGDKPIETLTAVEARKNHTPTDAVMDLMKENGIMPAASIVDTTGKDIPVQGGNIHLRIYTPKVGKGTFPIVVYFHGGGFVIASIEVYNA